ncbi:MAG: DNA polymerase III subunit beta [Lentisphaeria bacterium]|nr:DNA polymerase III subunit beta [Lentisphaeria bacterium]
MKVNVKKDVLLKALQKVSNIIGSRTTLPVLANVLLEADNGKLTLTTTDLELRIVTTVEAEVEVPGVTTLPAKRLLGLVSKFKGENMLMESNDKHHTQITCGTANFMILGLTPEDFPSVPVEFQATRSLKLKQTDFSRILDRISYAVSIDDSRKVLQGILLSVKEGNLTAVATDGKRLALVEKMLEDVAEGSDGDVIITIKVANEVKRLLEKEGEVVMEIGEKQVVFKLNGTIIYSKLIEGNYPNYRQVIPSSFNKKISVPTLDFVDALEIVSIPLYDASSSFVKITFTQNKLMFEANSNVGEGKEYINIEYADQDDISLSFNPQLLSDPFKHIGVDNVMVKINDAFSPIALESGDGFLYVIMPMRNK